MNVPIHLEGYDAIKALMDWQNAGKQGSGRYWNVQQLGDRGVIVRLSWRFGDSQLGGLERAAFSLQEATWLVLEEFKRVNATGAPR